MGSNLSFPIFSLCNLGQRAFSPIVPQFPHSVLLGLNELAYLKCLAQDLEKSRRSVNVSFCDCCSLKTGSVSLEEIF